ncbi:MAG: pyridoxamine 5'-phosphate oxidase family protein [Nocardioides sp.]
MTSDQREENAGGERLPESDELRVRRLPEYQRFDRKALDHILDEALVAHVGVVRDGRPLVLPMACARDGDALILHGSTGGGLLRIASGTPLSVAITHVDGLVYARSLFESSMHYRSAVVFGDAEVLAGEERIAALNLLSEHLFPGRVEEVRPHLKKELAATLVLRLPLERASVKISAGPADDPDDGESREVWAGIVGLRTVASEPRPAADVPDRVPVSRSAVRAARRHRG